MYVEIRNVVRKKKYYVVHATRIGRKIQKISRYLGSDLTEKQLLKLKKRAEEIILQEIKERRLLDFELTDDEIDAYQKYDMKIDISHFQRCDWKKFSTLFTYNTNAIEGSTVVLSEVKDLLQGKEKPQNVDELETMDVAHALEYVRVSREVISIDLIKKLHLLCFKRTKSFAGKLRKVEVVIRNAAGDILHQGVPAKQVVKQLRELCEWYALHKNKYPALFLAAVMHNEFETIHPFQDGNGRVGRLLLNFVLKKHKYPLINIRLKERKEYYAVLQSYQKRNDIKPTLRFLIKQYKIQYRNI